MRLAAEDGAYHSSAYSTGAAAMSQHQQQHQQQQQQQQHQQQQQQEQPPLQRRPARGPRDLRGMDGLSHVMESARDTAAACNEQDGVHLDGVHRGSDSSSDSSGHNDTDAAVSTHACLEPSLDRHWPSSPPCECYVHPVIHASLRAL
jgi:transcription initiation factor TFIID subunit TAF12